MTAMAYAGARYIDLVNLLGRASHIYASPFHWSNAELTPYTR